MSSPDVQGEWLGRVVGGLMTGDRVTLSTGGPLMVCDTSIRNDGLITCMRFVGDELVTEVYDPRCLARVDRNLEPTS